MIAPAGTLVPSNTLTPRRWAFESRPLRVEPPPLVLDISRSFPSAAVRSVLGRDRDGGDLHRGVVLAVAPPAAAAGLGLIGEPADLRSELFAHDARRHH